MISCTEFIPLYSEFFKFLEKRGGHDAVLDYWKHISKVSTGNKSNPNSLASKCEALGGFEGAVAYWGHTLTEEACDLFQVINHEKKFKYEHMRHCPSRGMLNSLSHIEPYYDYCSHCNVIYSLVLENYGITYERDNSMADRAECLSMLYETDNPPDFDFRTITDEEAVKLIGTDSEIVDMKSSDNKYLHRDFHNSGNNALRYCGEKFGDEAVIEFLRGFAKSYFAPLVAKAKECGLAAINEWLLRLYEVEEASDLISTELTEDKLTVRIKKSPAIEHMRRLNQTPSKYYVEETRTVYGTIAEECGFRFNLIHYGDDGDAVYEFLA